LTDATRQTETPTSRLTCREFADFIADFMDGSLPPAMRDRLTTHLSRCPSCQQYLGTYLMTIELSRTAFRSGEPVPADVPEELVSAILDARGRHLRN
jgi:hypothetical protein